MRSILEKAIVHLLNEEHDKAEALFHKFIVERARQIHESLRQDEDAVLAEGWDDEITSESYFTEADLEDLEDGEATVADADTDMGDVDADAAADMGDADVDAVEGDVDADMDGAADDVADASEELEGDLDAETGTDAEERMDDLEDQLERLRAEFETMMSGDESDEGEVVSDEMGDGEVVDHMEDDMEEKVTEGDESEEEDFASITESIAAELEKISVTLSDAKEAPAGGSFTPNKKSPTSGAKKADVNDAKPSPSKKSEHKGFERETAPAVAPAKKARNAKDKSTDGMPEVSKDGDASAALNKDFAGK